MASSNDKFVDGMIAATVLGLAAYGAYKVVQNLNKTPEQRLLEHLGNDLKAIDAGYVQDDDAGYDED